MRADFIAAGGLCKRVAGWLTTVFLLSIVSLSAHSQTDMRLIDAARSQDWPGVRSLLSEKDMDVNATQADGATTLAFAAYWDDVETVQRLLDVGADPNISNDYGITPLMLASENRSLAMLETLLNGKADPNVATWSGETLLMSASRTGFVEAVPMLLDHGADLNARDPRRGQNALMWAISYRSPDIARVLIERGADINTRTYMLKDEEEYTPLELEGYMGAPVKAVPMGGYTPLLFAAKVGDVATAKLLIDKGADINVISGTDGSPLIMAASQANENLALYLLEAGADPNAVDANGMTALHYALRDGIKVLHGEIITEKKMVCNFGGENFLCRPYETLNEELITYLNNPESEVYVIDSPNFDGYGEYDLNKPLAGPNMHNLVAALLDKGADPNAKMKYPPEALRLDTNPWFTLKDATPFFLASAAQDLDSVSVLLEEGAEPLMETVINPVVYNVQANHPAEDNMVVGNATTLMAAVGIGRRADLTFEEEDNAVKIAEILISLGADVNETTITGWTALHAAAFLGSDKLISFLVQQGAEIDTLTGCGRSPISMAMADRTEGMLDRTLPRPETANLLLDLGAGNKPPVGPIGECVGGRGGLEQEKALAGSAVDAIKQVQKELEQRKQNWGKG
jgi:ankyrin repeat protein